MSDRKQKQHYVPQFYLRNFSPEENKQHVFCYDKINNNSFTSSIRDICREINFYDSTEKSVEYAFMGAEGYWSRIFGKVIDAEDLFVLDEEEFFLLLVFLVFTKQRTKKRRDIVSSARIRWLEYINKQFTDWKIVPSSDDWKRRDHLLSMLQLWDEESKRLFKNNWELIINKTAIPFLTSDDPLLEQHVTTDTRFKEPYVKNYFPITPKMLMHSEPLSSQYFRPNKTEVSDINTVTNLNRLTFNNAYRFVISNSEDVFAS